MLAQAATRLHALRAELVRHADELSRAGFTSQPLTLVTVDRSKKVSGPSQECAGQQGRLRRRITTGSGSTIEVLASACFQVLQTLTARM